MQFDFEPGDYVIYPLNKDWGIGQVQSIIKNKVTVNFQNKGKQVINTDNVNLEKLKNVVLTSYRSSACISPYFFFNTENDIVILSKFLLNHEGMSKEYELMTNSFIDLAKRINNDFKHKCIYLPDRKEIIEI